jgi:uncharacterized protein YceK
MTNRAASCLTVVSVALLAGGCGTLENLREAAPPKYSCEEPMKTVYGGVTKDCASIEQACAAADWDVGLLLFASCDLPLTALGDTITLPYTLAYETGVFGMNRVCEFSGTGVPVFVGGLPPVSQPLPAFMPQPVP